MISQEKCTRPTDSVNNSSKFRRSSSPRAASVCELVRYYYGTYKNKRDVCPNGCLELDAVYEGIPVPLARSFVERPVHCDPGTLVVHQYDHLVLLSTSFADKVGAKQIISLDNLLQGGLLICFQE